MRAVIVGLTVALTFSYQNCSKNLSPEIRLMELREQIDLLNKSDLHCTLDADCTILSYEGGCGPGDVWIASKHNPQFEEIKSLINQWAIIQIEDAKLNRMSFACVSMAWSNPVCDSGQCAAQATTASPQ